VTRVCGCGKEYEYTSLLSIEYQTLLLSEKEDDNKRAVEIRPKLDFEMSMCPNICQKCIDLKSSECVSEYKEIETEDDNSKLDALGIRPRHYACTFDNFTPRNDEESKTLAMCKRMAESRRGMLALIGNNGTGKTHLASSIVRDIGTGKIYKMLEIGMFIREAFGNSSTKTEQEQLDKLIRLPFLAIDEAEKSKRTDNEMVWLSYIIDERNEHYRPTMLIANCHPKRTHTDGKTCERCFEMIMTPDVLDRFTQFGAIRYFDGESHRRELRGRE
jgi:DNA replication protein DnaC